MSREKAREVLEDGRAIYYGTWRWSGMSYSCGDSSCCFEIFESTEEMLDHLECMSGSNWDDVWFEEDEDD